MSSGNCVLDSMVISGEDVCCSVVFDTLVGVSVISVIWSDLLMTSAIVILCGMFMIFCLQCYMSVSTVL